MILQADFQDADTLTQIAIESKASWGYSQEQIDNWKEDLTITLERLNKWEFYKFVNGDEILGFSGLSFVSQQSVLEFLFISPKFMRKKIGKQLLDHALYRAKQKECMSMLVLSDPNAQSFYEKYGFKKFREEESSIPGRFLPWMIKQV